MPTSPDTDNYFIGKGIAKFTPTGGILRDLGNAPEVELTPNVDKLDHFSSRSGVKKKDRTVVVTKGMALRVVLDEITVQNLQMLLLGGEVADNSDGSKSFQIFAESEITGAFAFTGTNDVGNTVDILLPNIS